MGISSLVLSLPSVTNPSSHALRHLLPHLGPGGKMALTDNEVIVLIIFYIVLILVALAIYIFIKYSVTIVHHAEVMVIERFGKYRTTLKPGLHFLVPFADRPRSVSWRYKTVRPGATQETLVNHSTNRIDLREHVLDFGRQSVITKDTVSIDIDALLYFQIADPELVAFRIQNMPDALELLTKSSLRNAIASMNLDDTFSSREEINDVLLQKTYRDAERWGVSVRRVEVSDIIPPNDIKRAMEKQIREERYRRSLILSADGERESAVVRSRGHAAQMILRAEGERKSNIQLAKGDAEAKLLMARADAESITSVRNALANPNVDAAAFLVAVQYLRSLRRSASSFKSASVILLPVESVDQISDMVMKQANTRP